MYYMTNHESPDHIIFIAFLSNVSSVKDIIIELGETQVIKGA